MQQLGLNDVIQAVARQMDGGFKSPADRDAVSEMLFPALNQYPDNPALWFYAGYYFNLCGMAAVAGMAWERSYQLEPHAQVLTNYGAVLKSASDPEKARGILEKALLQVPYDSAAVCNYTGTFVNEGEPWPGIELGEETLKRGDDNSQTKFNLALLQLEAGNFARGFELYAQGHHEYRDRRTYEGAIKLTPANFEPGQGKRLLVYGEQGIGDELMFATLLGEASQDFEITFDCHPRLETLHQTAPWAERVKLYPTRKTKADWYRPGSQDLVVPIADLAQFYRKRREDFTWSGPCYKADPGRSAVNRRYLEELAEGRKIVGLALRGGTLKTARSYRSLDVFHIKPLLEREDLMFVCLDYDDVTQVMQQVMNTYGSGKMLWYPSITWAWDYQHLGDLMAACDATVSVCQSSAHLAAAMGLKTHVLCPSRPAWRYGLTEDDWYWYPSGVAKIHRQVGEDWSQAVGQVSEALSWPT